MPDVCQLPASSMRDPKPTKMMRFLVPIFLWIGLAWQAPLENRQNDKATGPLQFNSNGEFKIAIFEDLHFGESEYNPNMLPEGSQQKMLKRTCKTPGKPLVQPKTRKRSRS